MVLITLSRYYMSELTFNVLLHEEPVVQCHLQLSSAALLMQKEALPAADPER